MFYAASWSLFGKSYQFLFYLGIYISGSNCEMIKQENLERNSICQIRKTFFYYYISTLRCTKWNIVKLQQSSGKILFLKHFSYFLVIHKKCKKNVLLSHHISWMTKNKKDFFLFFIINFQKEKTNTFTILIILIVKCLQIELHSTNLLIWPPDLMTPQPAGINMQPPQSAITPRRLTLQV